MLTSGYNIQSLLLNHLARTLGLEALEFDDNGCCILKIDNNLLLSIVANNDNEVVLNLSKPRQRLSNETLISVLEANRT
ncbi:CesT family type III secretion system chaperone [Enterobacter ludwigii]|uniref:CesT family type III secretion system chaperone n=1 Tax=Enterobacter ludwigii TaxID=299767 RepID=UPI003974EB8B